MDSAQGPALAPIFEDLSQSEKLSEIKPPLKTPCNHLITQNICLFWFSYIFMSLAEIPFALPFFNRRSLATRSTVSQK